MENGVTHDATMSASNGAGRFEPRYHELKSGSGSFRGEAVRLIEEVSRLPLGVSKATLASEPSQLRELSQKSRREFVESVYGLAPIIRAISSHTDILY